MTRRSLRPQLNQIRSWVRQGRTDAWIAHQLEVPVQQIQAFKRENGLEPDNGSDGGGYSDDVDLRASDDAAIAAELEAEQARRAEEEATEEARKAAERARRAEQRKARAAAKKADADAEGDGDADTDGEADARKPTRSRRRTRGRVGTPATFEATFDHGEEGYGLWLDPAVQDDALYAEHWAGHRPIEVTIEEDQIVIKRADGGS